jgi:hypothetical protein
VGRNRKDKKEIKTSKTIRLTPKNWDKLKEEQKRLGHKYFVTTVEHIIIKYFKK